MANDANTRTEAHKKIKHKIPFRTNNFFTPYRLVLFKIIVIDETHFISRTKKYFWELRPCLPIVLGTVSGNHDHFLKRKCDYPRRIHILIC